MYLDRARDFVLGYLRLMKDTNIGVSYFKEGIPVPTVLLGRDSFDQVGTPEKLYAFVDAMFPKKTVIYERAKGDRLATPQERQAAVNRVLKIIVDDDGWFRS